MTSKFKEKSIVLVISTDKELHHSRYEQWLTNLGGDIIAISDRKNVITQTNYWNLRKYDIVLFENLFQQRSLAFLKILGADFKLGRILVEPNILMTDVDREKLMFENISRSTLDFVVAISELTEKQAEKFYPDTEIKKVEPSTTKDKRERLLEGTYRPESEVISSTGFHEEKDDIKNYGLLDEAIQHLKESNKDFESLDFRVAGNRNGDLNYNHIIDLGVLDKPGIVQLIKNSSLYIQPSKAETFGVSVLEAMQAGVPAIVGDNVGAKEVVERVDTNLVFESGNAEDLAKTIEYFQNLKNLDKIKLSQEFREKSLIYSPKPQKMKFKDMIQEVIEK